MHFPGHSFAQKRISSKRPRDLHIRKVSFSGCSLSACSLSSSPSASLSSSVSSNFSATVPYTPCSPSPYRRESTQEDPISPPPRLHERPFKERRPERRPPATFFFEEDEDEEDNVNCTFPVYEDDMYPQIVEVDGMQFHMELPPKSASSYHVPEYEEPRDYFFQYATSRPSLPRSRWSESTIQSVDEHEIVESAPVSPRTSTMDITPTTTTTEEHAPVVVELPAHFEQQRRPPMRPMDSVDNLMKKGGWKRRGVVFDQQEDEGFAL